MQGTYRSTERGQMFAVCPPVWFTIIKEREVTETREKKCDGLNNDKWTTFVSFVLFRYRPVGISVVRVRQPGENCPEAVVFFFVFCGHHKTRRARWFFSPIFFLSLWRKSCSNACTVHIAAVDTVSPNFFFYLNYTGLFLCRTTTTTADFFRAKISCLLRTSILYPAGACFFPLLVFVLFCFF